MSSTIKSVTQIKTPEDRKAFNAYRNQLNALKKEALARGEPPRSRGRQRLDPAFLAARGPRVRDKKKEAYERHIRNGTEPPASLLLYNSGTPGIRSSQIITWIETTLVVPEGRNVAKPVVLLPFQKKYIREVFDNPHGTRYALLSLSRKNGKTALTAFIALAYIMGPLAVQNSQVIAAAQNAAQASIIFKLMVKMLELKPELIGTKDSNGKLIEKVKITRHRMTILGLERNVEFKSIAKGNVLGMSPLVVIIDEVGSIPGPNDEFVESLLTAQGAYDNPIAFMISTQAASDTAFFSQLLDNAKRDKHTIAHLYTTPDTMDIMDQEGWELSNPGLGPIRSKQDLKVSLQRVVNMPSAESTARNLLLNQRVSQDNLLLSVGKWRESANKEFEDSDTPLHDYYNKYFKGNTIYAGLDLSTRIDLTACVLTTIDTATKVIRVLPLVFVPEDGLDERSRRDRTDYMRQAARGMIFPLEGSIQDYRQIALFIKEFMGDDIIEELLFDRWHIEHFKTAAEDMGLYAQNWVGIGQGFASMAPVLNSFEVLFMADRIEHPNCPALNTAASSAIVTIDPAGNRKANKAKSVSRIDPLIAMVMAAFPCGDSFKPAFDISALLG